MNYLLGDKKVCVCMGVLLDSERYYDVLSQSRPKAYI